MALPIGTRLGPYEILGPLGAGGMGEVYRARDTRLWREVALKILPAAVAGDSARRQRFELEARAVAALNHPNIVAIYDVGDGYIVTELVDGESLRGSKFGVRKTVDIAVQIARGLAAAHDAGIVHRDLKPDNILMTREGRIKILDFGLAKRYAASQAAAAETATVRTEPGMVMGTVGYMSPEQVRGVETDHRSDIFSFGLILYELLAGKRAFSRATAVEIMTAILKEDAPDLPETVPAGVRQIVAHCLEKEPSNRFQSARDLAFALSQFDRPSESSPAQRMRVGMPRRAAGVSIAVLVAATAFLAGRVVSHTPKPPRWSGVRLGGPEIAFTPRLSPDGHLLAFEAMDRRTTQVALMKPESGNWSILTHRRDLGTASSISWAPDGTKIYYGRFADAKAVYSVPVLGGEEHLVLANASEPEALPDGSLLVVRLNQQGQTQWFRFWPETGRFQDLPLLQSPKLLYAGMARAAPGGGTAVLKAFGIRENAIALYMLDLNSNSVRRITPPGRRDARITGVGVSADGKSVLAAVPAGAVERVVAYSLEGTAEHDLFTTTNDTWSLDQGQDGSVYASLLDRPAEIVRLSLNGGAPETLAAFPRLDDLAQILALPDGRMIVPEAAGRVRLMVVAPGKEPVPLIQTPEETSAPMAVVGSDHIAFIIGAGLHDTIATAEEDSGRIDRKIAPGKGMINSLAASPDGRTLFFSARDKIWSIPVSGGEPREICPGDGVLLEPSGCNLVVRRAGIPRPRIYRVPLNGGSEHEIPIDSSTPLWDAPVSPGALDRRGRLLASAALWDSWFNPLVVIDTGNGRITRVPANELRDYHSAAWLPDGRIAASQVATRATLWKFTTEPR